MLDFMVEFYGNVNIFVSIVWNMKCLIIIGRHAYRDVCTLHGQLAMYVLKQCLYLYVNACYMLGLLKDTQRNSI